MKISIHLVVHIVTPKNQQQSIIPQNKSPEMQILYQYEINK